MLANGLQFTMHCEINPVWNIVSSIYYDSSKLYFVASKVLECLRFGKSFDCFNFTIRYIESILIKTFHLFKYITNYRAVGVNLFYGNELIINYLSLKCESRLKIIYLYLDFPIFPTIVETATWEASYEFQYPRKLSKKRSKQGLEFVNDQWSLLQLW